MNSLSVAIGRIVCLAAAFMLATIPAGQAKIIYVKHDARGTNDGMSWANAYPDLQLGLRYAKTGDEIWVAKGTYKPNKWGGRGDSFSISLPIGIYGGFAGTETAREQRDWTANETILSGDIGTSGTEDNSYTVVSLQDGTIDGFTVTGGNSPMILDAGGISARQNAVAANCKITRNQGAGSGGMFEGTAIHCVFSENSGGDGGGSSSVIAQSCTYLNNSASREGGGSYEGSATGCIYKGNTAGHWGGGMFGGDAKQCVFEGNTATGRGGALCFSSASACVITSNSAQTGGGLSVGYASNCTIMNNRAEIGGGIAYLQPDDTPDNLIVWNNTATTGSQVYGYQTYYNCNIQGCGGSGAGWDKSVGVDGGGNIDADPRFVDAAHPAGADAIWITDDDGLRLQNSSLCVNAGTTDTALNHDILGHAWVDRPDMGAYENLTPASEPGTVIYVKHDARGTNDGTSWANAFTDLQLALRSAESDQEIWVAAGTYQPTTGTDRRISFEIGPDIAVYGGFAGMETLREQRDWTAHETILSGDLGTTHSYHVVISENGVLDGFTITGGNADDGTASGRNNYGGGVLGEIMIENCKFIDNAATFGGGFATFSQNLQFAINCKFINNRAKYYGGGSYRGALERCIITSNTAQYGGGTSNCFAYRCVITSNNAETGGGDWNSELDDCVLMYNSAQTGGGSVASFPTHCTIAKNKAVKLGGISPLIKAYNCIVWDNSATTWPQVADYSYFRHCDIQGCNGGEPYPDANGNFSADPKFVDMDHPEGPDGTWITDDDGLRINNGSACINAGMFAGIPIDILGHARAGYIPDVGAYENPTVLPYARAVVYDGATTVTYDSWVSMGTFMKGAPAPTKTLTIKNLGTSDLYTSNTKIAAPFQIVTPPAARIAPGASSPFVVSVSTQTTGSLAQYLSFNSNDAQYPWFQFHVAATIATPIMEVLDINQMRIGNGGSVLLRSTVAGASAATAKLTLKNTGKVPLTIGTPAIAPPFQITNAPASTIPEGASTMIVVSLPTASADSFASALSFATNDPRSPSFTVSVSGIVQSNPKIIYVRADSSATSDTANLGASWATAYPDLQSAIAAARPGNQIWVAAGTYKPTGTTDTAVSFVMPEDVEMHGGFTGTETSPARDWKRHPSILSGDIGTSAALDNSVHVVIGGNRGMLDGFTISGGYSAQDGPNGHAGGGMLNVSASPIIINCAFENNQAFNINAPACGGAIFNSSSAPSILNCVFTQNSARGMYDRGYVSGGAISNREDAAPKIINCVFYDNSAVNEAQYGYACGGAIDERGSSMIVNCTFAHNRTVAYILPGAAISIAGTASTTIVNSIFWDNSVYSWSSKAEFSYCDIPECGGSGASWKSTLGIDGGGNIDIDPMFVNAANPAGADGLWRTDDDGLQLKPLSPCINKGTPSPTPPTDILGKPRFDGNDMGAYEYPLRNAAASWAMYR